MARQDTEDDMHMARDTVSAALPADTKSALSILFAVAAARVIDSGHSDAQAVDGFLSTLRYLRERARRERVN